jgi:hypothetical protein
VAKVSDMDAVWKEYETAVRSGDPNAWKIINEKLALGATEDLGDIAYIKISPDEASSLGLSFDMPTGNESGVYDWLWLIGGQTKGRQMEAVLVGSEKITYEGSKGKGSFEELLKNFKNVKRGKNIK